MQKRQNPPDETIVTQFNSQYDFYACHCRDTLCPGIEWHSRTDFARDLDGRQVFGKAHRDESQWTHECAQVVAFRPSAKRSLLHDRVLRVFGTYKDRAIDANLSRNSRGELIRSAWILANTPPSVPLLL